MKRKKVKTILVLVTILGAISIGINTYAHSGRTDSSGGHKDNKNKSGLGSYHYHCGGHPAHLHTNGRCPYSSSKGSTSSSSSNKSSTSNSSSNKSNTSSSSSTTTTTVTQSTIAVTAIQINEKIENLEVGNSKTLTTTITPNNATDKTITWKSSDKNIVTISSSGEIIAKNAGIAEITAVSSNGKTSTIRINVREANRTDSNNITEKTNTNVNNTIINGTTKYKEDSNPMATIATLGILGGASFWGYKKYKNSK